MPLFSVAYFAGDRLSALLAVSSAVLPLLLTTLLLTLCALPPSRRRSAGVFALGLALNVAVNAAAKRATAAYVQRHPGDRLMAALVPRPSDYAYLYGKKQVPGNGPAVDAGANLLGFIVLGTADVAASLASWWPSSGNSAWGALLKGGRSVVSGMPSLHAQLVAWVLAMLWRQTRVLAPLHYARLRAALLLYAALVAWSRVYLAYHNWSQVFLGLLVGLLLSRLIRPRLY